MAEILFLHLTQSNSRKARREVKRGEKFLSAEKKFSDQVRAEITDVARH